MKNYSAEQHINVGSGIDITIEELARLLMEIIGFSGTLGRDEMKPDGTPRKLMDSGKLAAMGWRPSITLEEGLSQTYAWFLGHCA
jgi:GDP-L-fucose synthase